MTQLTRRHAIGTTVALAPAMAAATTDTATGNQEARTRQAIEAYARAWEKGDMPALMNCYHADFTLNYYGRNALSGRHVGKATSLKVLGEVRQRTDRKLKAIQSLMVGGDRAAMSTRESLTARGRTVEVERLYVFTVSGTQLLECWVYDQDQRLVDELFGT